MAAFYAELFEECLLETNSSTFFPLPDARIVFLLSTVDTAMLEYAGAKLKYVLDIKKLLI